MSARREPRLEPGPWAVLCRSEWSLTALAVGALRLRYGDRLTAPSRTHFVNNITRPELVSVAVAWLDGPTASGGWHADQLRDWYESGGELP